MARWVANLFIGLPAIYSLVALSDGRIGGTVFLDEGDPIRGAIGVRLVQEAFNTQAMGLYASLGFAVKEPLVRITGRPRSGRPVDVDIRRLAAEDLEECDRLCRRVHGITRTDDLRDALRLFNPFACVRGGRITAYSYAVHGGILAWGVAETDEDMQALLAGIASTVPDPLSLHLLTRQEGFVRWCLKEGFRIEKPLTLMATGEYHDPRGCYVPSGVY